MIRSIAPLLLLAGCAASVISSNPRSVVIDAGKPPLASRSSADAQRLADQECAKHNRHARMTGRPEPYRNEYVFDCVD